MRKAASLSLPRLTRATFTIAVALLWSTAAAGPPVTFESPCECRDAHGKARLAVKSDPSTPPANANAIQSITPSDIYSWPGPDVPLTQSSQRTGIGNKWFALTGRVVALKVEADASARPASRRDRKQTGHCGEIPAKPQWCEIRNTVFGWTHTLFPFHTSSAKKLALNQTSVPSRG
jgi:hypothetical protein